MKLLGYPVFSLQNALPNQLYLEICTESNPIKARFASCGYILHLVENPIAKTQVSTPNNLERKIYFPPAYTPRDERLGARTHAHSAVWCMCMCASVLGVRKVETVLVTLSAAAWITYETEVGP